MSGDVGAEVAADMLDAAILGVVDVESASPDPSVEEYARAVLTAIAPLIAERVEAAKAEALREAADRIASGDADHEELRLAGVDDIAKLGWSDKSVTLAHNSGDVWATWLRDRAAALDPGPRSDPRHEGKSPTEWLFAEDEG